MEIHNKVIADSEVDNNTIDPAGHDSSLVEESSDTFYSSTGSSPPHEIPGLQLQCYVLLAEEEFGVPRGTAPAEWAMPAGANKLLETLQDTTAVIRTLTEKGWEPWASDRAIYFSHSEIRFRSDAEAWDYISRLGIDLGEVSLFPYPGACDAVETAADATTGTFREVVEFNERREHGDEFELGQPTGTGKIVARCSLPDDSIAGLSFDYGTQGTAVEVNYCFPWFGDAPKTTPRGTPVTRNQDVYFYDEDGCHFADLVFEDVKDSPCGGAEVNLRDEYGDIRIVVQIDSDTVRAHFLGAEYDVHGVVSRESLVDQDSGEQR